MPEPVLPKWKLGAPGYPDLRDIYLAAIVHICPVIRPMFEAERRRPLQKSLKKSLLRREKSRKKLVE